MTGCSACIPNRKVIGVAFCHYFVYGLFAVIFVFTNECYPLLYYVDYMFGISGAVLIAVSIVGWIFANLKRPQIIRFIAAIVVLLNVLLVVVSTFFYTIERWNDVMVTAVICKIRTPLEKDFNDNLWFALVVIACLNTPVLIFYLYFVLKNMCNSWKSDLFVEPHQNLLCQAPFGPEMCMRTPIPNAPPPAKNT